LSQLRSKRSKIAVSAVIGTVIMFAMLLSVAGSYFYFIQQDQATFQKAVAQSNNNLLAAQSAEHMTVYGISQSGELAFYINNTGIAISIVSYWVLNGTSGSVIQYKNSTSSTSLPFLIGQGQSSVFGATRLNPNIVIPLGAQYVIKVLTSRGTQGVGTYPSQQLTSATVNSLVAGGFGSLQITFSSFEWYSYTSGPPQTVSYDIGGSPTTFNNLCASGSEMETNCNGGSSYILDINHPHVGSLVPGGYEPALTYSSTSRTTTTTTSHHFGGGTTTYTLTSTTTTTTTTTKYFQTPAVFSVNVTNYDPQLGTIVINSASNLWVVEVCDSGVAEGNCPSGNPFFVFYLMDVNPSTGAVTSSTAGSFAEIVIPYGVTKTLYYGAAYDLSLQDFSSVGLTSSISTNPFYYGQFAVFLLFSGTKIIAPSVLVYGQNVPFETTTAADNFGWVSQTPTSCNHGVSTTFSLLVNDSIFAYANPTNFVGIKSVVINSSAFSSVSVLSSPTGWTGTANSPSAGYITWSTGIQANYITNGTTDTFAWKGTAPSPTSSTQYIFPVTVTWSTGEITTVQSALMCTVV
jgi:hypothetical protein